MPHILPLVTTWPYDMGNCAHGYRLVRVHLDAVDRVREHKPRLPEKGYEGIPMRDLWEFEKLGPLGVPVP
jgi:hypothetical protein